eukprot:2337023-Prymnesium_polylepis.5
MAVWHPFSAAAAHMSPGHHRVLFDWIALARLIPGSGAHYFTLLRLDGSKVGTKLRAAPSARAAAPDGGLQKRAKSAPSGAGGCYAAPLWYALPVSRGLHRPLHHSRRLHRLESSGFAA